MKHRVVGVVRVAAVGARLWIASLILSGLALALAGSVARQNTSAIAVHLRSGDAATPSTLPLKLVRPLWWFGANQPGVQMLRLVPGAAWIPQTLSAVSASWGSVSALADEALNVSKQVDAGVLNSDGSFNVEVASKVAIHAEAMRRPVERVKGLVEFLASDRGPWWQVSERAPLVTRLFDAHRAATGGIEALAMADEFLLGDVPRTVFVGITNPAEARGVHGIIGQYAVVIVGREGITVRELDSNLALQDPTALPETLSAGYGNFYGMDNPEWQNMTLSPFVDDAAEQISSAWKQMRGETLDAVVLLDTVALGQIATSNGETYLSAQGRLLESPQSLSDYLSNGLYLEFPLDNLERKEFQTALGGQLVASVVDRLNEVRTLIPALILTLRQGRVVFWVDSAHTGGSARQVVLGPDSDHFGSSHIAVRLNNFSGNKMDFYLQPSLTLEQCAGVTTLKLGFTNKAPPKEDLPDYVLRRLDPIGGNPGSFAGVSLTLGRGWEVLQWSEDDGGLEASFDEQPWGQRLRLWLDVTIGQTRTFEVVVSQKGTPNRIPEVDLAPLSTAWTLDSTTCRMGDGLTFQRTPPGGGLLMRDPWSTIHGNHRWR